jgi:ABC-type multidrug transport system ATPase subunit
VCKQDDYLYPDLSAKEHLEVFGGLRGVPRHELPQTVQKWLESVDLAVVQDQYSEAYSGGMKRRLSLACSTIGGRPLIILDEPTTGETRLFRWLTPLVVSLDISHNSSCCPSQAWIH